MKNYEIIVTLYINADSAEDAERIADELVHVNASVTDKDIEVLNPNDWDDEK